MEVDEYYTISAAACLGDDETLYFIELRGMRFVRDTGYYLWFEQNDLDDEIFERTYAIERQSIIDIALA